MNTTGKRADIEDEEPLVIATKSGLVLNRKQKVDADFFLDTFIGEVSTYRDVLHYINNMESGDELKLWLDTDGGLVETTQRLIQAIRNTKGTVVVIGAGKANSCGSILFLQAPQLIVTANMTMMIHAISYGNYGKQGEIASAHEFNQRMINRLMDETYAGFLTPVEIRAVKDGRDFYFDSEEISARLAERERLQTIEMNKKTRKKPKAT